MKLKTHKGVQKRIKVTATGRLLRRRVRTSHLKTKQSSNKKREKSRLVEIRPADKKKINQLLPNK